MRASMLVVTVCGPFKLELFLFVIVSFHAKIERLSISKYFCEILLQLRHCYIAVFYCCSLY